MSISPPKPSRSSTFIPLTLLSGTLLSLTAQAAPVLMEDFESPEVSHVEFRARLPQLPSSVALHGVSGLVHGHGAFRLAPPQGSQAAFLIGSSARLSLPVPPGRHRLSFALARVRDHRGTTVQVQLNGTTISKVEAPSAFETRSIELNAEAAGVLEVVGPSGSGVVLIDSVLLESMLPPPPPPPAEPPMPGPQPVVMPTTVAVTPPLPLSDCMRLPTEGTVQTMANSDQVQWSSGMHATGPASVYYSTEVEARPMGDPGRGFQRLWLRSSGPGRLDLLQQDTQGSGCCEAKFTGFTMRTDLAPGESETIDYLRKDLRTQPAQDASSQRRRVRTYRQTVDVTLPNGSVKACEVVEQEWERKEQGWVWKSNWTSYLVPGMGWVKQYRRDELVSDRDQLVELLTSNRPVPYQATVPPSQPITLQSCLAVRAGWRHQFNAPGFDRFLYPRSAPPSLGSEAVTKDGNPAVSITWSDWEDGSLRPSTETVVYDPSIGLLDWRGLSLGVPVLQGAERVTYLGPERLSTPVGLLNVCKVEVAEASEWKRYRDIRYYAPGWGLVRTEFADRRLTGQTMPAEAAKRGVREILSQQTLISSPP